MMKKKCIEPETKIQRFMPNEYISACGELDDGTVLYSASISVETAYERTPAGQDAYVLDDNLSKPHTIYMGAFYWDKELTMPDSTAHGHVEQEDFGPKRCVREDDKSPRGYHYHFKKVSGHS